MALKDIFESISKKTAEAEKQQAEITRKLEANKSEKARAETARAKALEAKDEQAYKAACRDIVDADAGIEFNTICLREAKQKKLATEADDAKIKSGLHQGMQEIFADAILKFEKLVNEMRDISESTMEKMNEIDGMAASWDKDVMKNHEYKTPFCNDRTLFLKGFYNSTNARLNQLEGIKKVLSNERMKRDAAH